MCIPVVLVSDISIICAAVFCVLYHSVAHSVLYITGLGLVWDNVGARISTTIQPGGTKEKKIEENFILV